MKIQKRFLTLIEMMIVMFLIMLITGVVAYNYKGSLDEGKAFKTNNAIKKIDTVLNLAVAQDPSLISDIESRWESILKTSPLVQNPQSLMTDGWGYKFEVHEYDGQIYIKSKKYEDYKKTHNTMFKD